MPEGDLVSLSPNAQALLTACANAIASDSPSELNLIELTRERGLYDEAPRYLAEKVEEISRNRYTVRKADVALFKGHVKGAYMYLVRCAYGMPEDTVLELTGDMFLVGCGSYNPGLDLHAEPASPEGVASYRAFVAKSDRERQERQEAEDFGEACVETIKQRLQVIVDAHPDKELRGSLSNRLRNMSYGDPSLKDIIAICYRLGVDFADIVKTSD
jgi:hypothetical protein